MARPWPPKGPKGPKPTFYVKPKVKKVPAMHTAKVRAEDPYKDGMLRMFLDDERPCPGGFTLYRDLAAFEEGLAAADLSTIYAISLDWYLGAGVANGEKAAEIVADLIRAKRAELTNLRIISCHSSDVEKAIKMARTIAEPLREETTEEEDRYGYIAVDVGKTIGKL